MPLNTAVPPYLPDAFPPSSFNTLCDKTGIFLQSSDSVAREQLEKVLEILDTERCTTFEDCIAWARRRFQVSCILISCNLIF